MTNVLIRRLMNCGYTPDTASKICFAYISDFSLTDLDSAISIMEADRNVDKIQPESNREECGRLLSQSYIQST